MDIGRGSEKDRPRPCRYYRHGACRLGTSCPFLHEDSRDSCEDPRVHTSSLEAHRARIPCRFWASGHCREGDRCPYLHLPRTEDYDVHRDRRSRQPSENDECAELNGRAEKRRRLEMMEPDTYDRAPDFGQRGSRPQVCRYFENGKCKKGESCDFAHVLACPPHNNDRFDNTVPRSQENSQYNHGEERRRGAPPERTCRLWAAGQCTSGSQCRFSHCIVDTFHSDRICADWLRGSCSFGEVCKFRHETVQEKDEQNSRCRTADRIDDVDTGRGLKPGWELRHTPSGRIYFVDHINRRTTWNDPRSDPPPYY
jgi:hypothetical protein